MPKADIVVGAEKTENQNETGDATQIMTEISEVPPPSFDANSKSNSDALLAATTNLNDHLTTLHAVHYASLPRAQQPAFDVATRRAEHQQGKTETLCIRGLWRRNGTFEKQAIGHSKRRS